METQITNKMIARYLAERLNAQNNQEFIDNQNKRVASPSATVSSPVSHSSKAINDVFISEQKKNGIIEKIFDFAKGAIGFGVSSKKVKQRITAYENGEISEQEVKTSISKYRASQEGAEQGFGNTVSGLGAVLTYFGLTNQAKKLNARFEVGAVPQFIEELSKNLPAASKIKSIITSNKKTLAIILPLTMAVGGMAKLVTLKFNRIGTKEFTVDNKESLSKQEYKAAKKELGKQKFKKRLKQDFKNLFTGALNGLLAPVAGLAGGIVGVPAYLAAMTGIKYATGESKNKSLKGFAENIGDTAGSLGITALALGIPALTKARYSKTLAKNLEIVTKKLKGVTLQAPDLPSDKTAFNEIQDILLGSKGIKKILDNAEGLSVEEQIVKLTDENIFAVKFMQIDKGKLGAFNSNISEISSKLIENCPPSRDLLGAQEEVNKLLGSQEYKLEKLLGVGTVAETYLAKDSNGKEVAVKILKKGIALEKIQKDKEALINIISEGKPLEQLSETQKYLIRNVENLSEGISKEVDFVNEMKAAQELKKYTQKADVVTPIEAKPGIYVMEKAPGISLDTLTKYCNLMDCRNFISKWEESEYKANQLAKIDQRIKKLKERSPDFENFEITTPQLKKLLNNYIEVLTEQFSKLERDGKVVHADIHPGNIFINLQSLQTGKGKLFTLIDTGNTINLNKEQTAMALKLTSYIKKGNVDDVVRVSLKDAILPEGLAHEEAVKAVTKDMKQIFFDNKTKINPMSVDEFYNLFNNVSRKYNIIPNNTQLNMEKAKKSANNSFEDLVNNFFQKKVSDLDPNGGLKNASKAKQLKQGAKLMGEAALVGNKYIMTKSAQEANNLFKMSPKQAWNHFFNKNNLKSNSEEYLTYKFKQNMESDLADMFTEP